MLSLHHWIHCVCDVITAGDDVTVRSAYRAMEKRSSMSSGDGAKPSGRRRSSRSARLAARSREIDARRPMMALTSGGLSVSEATERRWKRSSLACWRPKTRTERPLRLLRVAALPLDVVTLGGRGSWAGVRGGITVGPEGPSTLGGRRGSEGD